MIEISFLKDYDNCSYPVYKFINYSYNIYIEEKRLFFEKTVYILQV